MSTAGETVSPTTSLSATVPGVEQFIDLTAPLPVPEPVTLEPIAEPQPEPVAPDPGSYDALADGCLCAPVQEGHVYGGFTVTAGCPLHAPALLDVTE